MRPLRSLTAALAALSFSTSAAAGPTLVIFGGADGPSNNQASIEAQAKALLEVLGPAQPALLFGGAGTRSVREETPGELDEDTGWLGAIFGAREGVVGHFRATELPAIPATWKSFKIAIDRGQTNPEGTIIFGVGHGSGRSQDEAPTLSLWTQGGVNLESLASHLDRKKRRGPLAMVLGQCYSGAFADLMYRGADPSAVIAEPTRCVLAAAPADRTASGCTSDVNDPWARAYMREIAEALRDPSSDLDQDGQISLAEAHARAMIQDQTTDVPVRSSELYARGLSESDQAPRLPFQDLLRAADPEERAILSALAPSGADDPRKAAETTKERVDQEAAAAEAHMNEAIHDAEDAEDEAHRRVIARWPDLISPYRPAARRLLADSTPAIIAEARKSGLLRRIQSLDRVVGEADERWSKLLRTSARLERFLRTAELVEAKQRLRERAHPRELAILDRLLRCERLSPLPSPLVTPAPSPIPKRRFR
ncbi:MAG: hypothetical protein U1E65_28255 [Myxococcota bacterium]